MDITEKIDGILNESSWQSGMWVVQRRSGENEYAILVDQLKGGAWKGVSIDDDRMVAAKKSLANAYPPFEELKDKKEIPQKLLNKIQKKLNQLKIDLKV